MDRCCVIYDRAPNRRLVEEGIELRLASVLNPSAAAADITADCDRDGGGGESSSLKPSSTSSNSH